MSDGEDLDSWLAEAEEADRPRRQTLHPAPEPQSCSSGSNKTKSAELPSTQLLESASPTGTAQVRASKLESSLDPLKFAHEFSFDDQTAQHLLSVDGGWKYAWSPDILEPTLLVRRSRGKQLRPVRTASLFTGTAAGTAGFRGTGIAERSVFTCDNSVASWQWIRNHGPEHGCHFLDARELIDTGSCYCVRHQQICQLADLDIQDLDEVEAGFACQPFSMSRSGRHEGTQEHPDYDLYAKTIRFVKRHQPKRCRLENVWGFMVPENRQGGRAPIYDLLDLCAQEVPNYPALSNTINAKYL